MQIFLNGKILHFKKILDFWWGAGKDHKTKLFKELIRQDLGSEKIIPHRVAVLPEYLY